MEIISIAIALIGLVFFGWVLFMQWYETSDLCVRQTFGDDYDEAMEGIEALTKALTRDRDL